MKTLPLYCLLTLFAAPGLACNEYFLSSEMLLKLSIKQNRQRMAELWEIKPTKDIITKPGEIVIRRQGLAPEYKILESDEATVYRHYTTPEFAALIRSSGVLKAGPRPSAITLNTSLELNTDIYGVFFTQAKASRRVPSELVAIDFTLPEGYVIVQTFHDEFVIPGPKPLQDWLIKEINRNPSAYPEYLADLRLDETGKYVLKNEAMLIPIRIVPESP